MAAKVEDTNGSNVCKTLGIEAGDSVVALTESVKPDSSLLEVHKVDQSNVSKSAVDSQPVNVDTSAIRQSPTLDLKKNLETNVTDLRRYSRACKEKKEEASVKVDEKQKQSTNKVNSQLLLRSSPSIKLAATQSAACRPIRQEKIHAQQKISSRFKSGKPRGKGYLRENLDRKTLPSNIRAVKSGKRFKMQRPQQENVSSSSTNTCDLKIGEGKDDEEGVEHSIVKLGALQKTSTSTRLPSELGVQKRKYKRRRSWWKEKRKAQRTVAWTQDAKAEACGEEVCDGESDSVGSQSPVEESKIDLAKSSKIDSPQEHCEPESCAEEQRDGQADDEDPITKSLSATIEVEEEIEDVGKSSERVAIESDLGNHGSNSDRSQPTQSTQDPFEMAETEMEVTDLTIDTESLDNDPDVGQSLQHRDHLTSNTPTTRESYNIPYIQPDGHFVQSRRRGKSKTEIKCEYCGRMFIHTSAYVIHRRIHTGEKPHACQVCGRAFAQRSNLTAHMRTHEGTPSLMCCGIHFARISSFRKHRKTHKGEELQQKTCPICGISFQYQSFLESHMKIHSGVKPYPCKVCGKSFSQVAALRIHEKIHWPVKPYVCSKCGQGYSQISTLKRIHVCKVKTEQPTDIDVAYRCQFCHKCFNDKNQYEDHVLTHNDVEQHMCTSCGERFTLESELEAHSFYCPELSTNHSSQSPLYLRSPSPQATHDHAESVPFSFKGSAPKISTRALKSLLQTNVKTTVAKPRRKSSAPDKSKGGKKASLLTCPVHVLPDSVIGHPENTFAVNRIITQLNKLDKKPDPRKYFCPRCGRLFRHVMRLRAHMLTHSQRACYTCEDCGKTMKSWRLFWQHQRVHRQTKGRFFCPSCNRGFRFASSYQDHLRGHPELNTFICSHCPRSFINADHLKAHQREEHKEILSYVCDVCGKGFSCQLKLDLHSVSHRTNTHIGHTSTKQQQTGVLPYQCAKCNLTFKTIDQLFQHQLCHSPMNDKQSLKAGSLQKMDSQHHAIASPPGLATHLKSQTTSSLVNSGSPLQASSPREPLSSQDPTAARPRSSPNMHKSLPQPARAPHARSPLVEEKSVQKSFTSLGTGSLRKQLPELGIPLRERASMADEGSSSCCAECGASFSGVSELFEHYLLHARGEV